MSPTVKRIAVLRWIELIHPNLPALVQRTFAYDLQRMTERYAAPNSGRIRRLSRRAKM